ncbi:MAG: hypothetical protein E7559_07255 [Ruminococcaceae bacterium]|nr:hypothetical protein [Oscillospiraceae bacterium]
MQNTKSTNTRARNTFLNTVAGVTAKLVNIAAGLVMRWVFIYTLGEEYLGVKGLFTSVLTMLSFAELGLSGAITYAMYKPVAEGNNQRIAALLNFYKTAYRMVAASVMVLGLALLPFMHIIVPPDKVSPEIYRQIYLIYILYVANTAISYLLIYKTTLLTAHQEHRYVSRVQTIFSVIRVTVECITLFIFKNFIVYLVLGILITRGQNWVTSRYAEKRYPELKEHSDAQLTAEEKKKLLRDVGAKMLYKVSNALMHGCDNVIISAVFGSTMVGYVDNYTMVTKRVNNLVNQFYNSASPSIGNLAAQSDSQRQYSTFRMLHFTAFWVCCFAATSFITLLNPFIGLWLGDSFQLSALFVLVVTFQFYINSMIHPVSAFRDTNGLFVQGRFRPVVMACINIGLSILFALHFRDTDVQMGIIGVKAATSIAQILTMQWFDPMLVFKRVFKVSLLKYYRNWFIFFFLTAGSCALTWYISTFINFGSTFLTFGTKMLLCLIIPNTIVVLFYHRTEEFRQLMATLKRIYKKKRGKKKAAPKAVSAE